MENLLKFNFLKTPDAKIGEQHKDVDKVSNNITKSDKGDFFIDNLVITNGSEKEIKGLIENSDASSDKIETNPDNVINQEENNVASAINSFIVNEDHKSHEFINENIKNNSANHEQKKNNFSKVDNKEVKNKVLIFNENLSIEENNKKINSSININQSSPNPKVHNASNLSEIFSKIRNKNKARLKSFFQNYINYSLKKYSKKNLSLKKINILEPTEINNSVSKGVVSKEVVSHENSAFKLVDKVQSKSKNTKISESINKENNSFYENNIKDKNINYSKEVSFENFDRLKNILDIKSNDLKQRFTQILENNMRLNNNKFEIQLRPENLGKIHITLEISGQNVDININSDNINAIQSLTENNSNLQKMLQNHGMNLNNFNFNGNNKGRDKQNQKFNQVKEDNTSVNTNVDNKNEQNKMSNNLVYVKA
jgi:flagellar hook-length control protein FliK